jgi:predicted  nucleic acid-binding Zn-ribbon protein
MLKKLKEQQAKLEAYEQEKEKAAESMQDQDSDVDDLETQGFPGNFLDMLIYFVL